MKNVLEKYYYTIAVVLVALLFVGVSCSASMGADIGVSIPTPCICADKCACPANTCPGGCALVIPTPVPPPAPPVCGPNGCNLGLTSTTATSFTEIAAAGQYLAFVEARGGFRPIRNFLQHIHQRAQARQVARHGG